jgi:hypothetical protein
MEAQVLCREAEEAACGLRFGLWWKIFPDRVVPDLPDAESTPLTPGKFQTLRLVYAAGRCSLSVDGEPRLEVPVPATADARPVIFGHTRTRKDTAGARWRRLKLRFLEQRTSAIPRDGTRPGADRRLVRTNVLNFRTNAGPAAGPRRLGLVRRLRRRYFWPSTTAAGTRRATPGPQRHGAGAGSGRRLGF